MDEFEVQYISKDNHVFTCVITGDKISEVIEKGLSIIADKGWDIYEYRFSALKKKIRESASDS
jgi:hypothetical protein